MRGVTSAGLAGLALVALAACHKPAPAPGGAAVAPTAAPSAPAAGPLSMQDLPHQKPGLWRTSMTMEGSDRAMPTSEICMDAASEAKMSIWSRAVRKDRCPTAQFSRNLDGSISFKTTCDFGSGGTKVTSGTVTGDFSSSYKIAIDSVTTAAASPGANGEQKMTISATWVGPCAPGQKGGDVIMPNGKSINVGG